MQEAGDTARYEVRSADGTVIPVWKSGSGRPLLCLHGGLNNHTAFDPVRPYFEPHSTVLVMDRRSSFGDPLSRYSPEREFEDIAAVASTVAGELDVVGHSSGALCALESSLGIANLRRLILYEPPFPGPQWLPLSKRLGRLQAAGDYEGILEAFYGVQGTPAAVLAEMKASPDWPRRLELARFLPREAAAITLRPDPERFRALTVPMLLLVGADTPEGHHHRGYVSVLQGVVPRITVREIPEQRHGAMTRAPDVFARMVLDFLEVA